MRLTDVILILYIYIGAFRTVRCSSSRSLAEFVDGEAVTNIHVRPLRCRPRFRDPFSEVLSVLSEAGFTIVMSGQRKLIFIRAIANEMKCEYRCDKCMQQHQD